MCDIFNIYFYVDGNIGFLNHLMEAVYDDLFQSFSGHGQSPIKPRASTSVGTIHQISLSYTSGPVRNHTDQVTQWRAGVTFAGEQRDESSAGGTQCSWSALPFSRHSDVPQGWQAPSLQEGNSLSAGWEKKFKSLPCVLRENKNLSVCVYEKISHLIPAGGK